MAEHQPKRQWIGGADPRLMTQAWAWIDGATKPGQTALLALSTKGNLDGIVSDTVGETSTKLFARGGPVALPSGGQVVLMTERAGAPRAWIGGPVLVAYGDDALLDKVEDLDGVTETVAVAWLDDDIAGWVRTWNVPRLGEAPPPERPRVSNPVVARALKSLVTRINTSTGLAHPWTTPPLSSFSRFSATAASTSNRTRSARGWWQRAVSRRGTPTRSARSRERCGRASRSGGWAGRAGRPTRWRPGETRRGSRRRENGGSAPWPRPLLERLQEAAMELAKGRVDQARAEVKQDASLVTVVLRSKPLAKLPAGQCPRS